MPNSFMLFQFSTLDPNRDDGHARGSKISTVQPHCSWNLWRKTAFFGHEKKTVVRFLMILFYFGAERKQATSTHKTIFSSQVLCSRDEELDNIPLMTCFCRFNLVTLVMCTMKILESDIRFIIFPIFHCSQEWGSKGDICLF